MAGKPQTHEEYLAALSEDKRAALQQLRETIRAAAAGAEERISIDFMFFTTDFICSCLNDSGFEKIEIIERDPYPGVEYESRRAYVFAIKPADAVV